MLHQGRALPRVLSVFLAATVIGIGLLARPSPASAAVDLTGNWHFTIVIDTFHITSDCDASFLQEDSTFTGTFDCGEDGNGTLSGTLTDATQGANLDALLTLHAGSFDIEAQAQGTVSADSNSTSGTWEADVFGGVNGTFEGQRSPFPKGDLNCDGLVNAADALVTFTHLAGAEPIQGIACPDLGSGVVLIFGNMDCDQQILAGDGLDILRYSSALPVTLPPGCAPLGR